VRTCVATLVGLALLTTALALSAGTGPTTRPIVFATDGDEHKGNADIFVASNDRRPPRNVTTTRGVRELDATPAPSGNLVAYTTRTSEGSRASIVVTSLRGGKRRTVYRGPELHSGLAWSPDCKRIAFLAGPWEAPLLYVAKVDGSGSRRLAPAATTSFYVPPSWSPDSSKLTWTVVADRFDTVAVIRADGTGRRLLVHGGDPVWAPHGDQIAYSARKGDGTSYLGVIGSDRRGSRLLVYGGVSRIAWAPDGSSLAFNLRPESTDRVFVVSAAGGDAHPIAPEWSSAPTWSPDSRFLAYVEDRGDPGTIHRPFPADYLEVVAATGGRAKVISRRHYDTISPPHWTADAGIVFSSQIARQDFEIATLDPMTRVVREFSHDLSDDVEPTLSPDGSTIAFVRGLLRSDDLPALSDGVVGSVWLMDSDGRHLRPLTRRRSDEAPAWSPFGKMLAFVRRGDIYLVASEGGRPRRITRGGRSFAPAWSPAGGAIAFERDRRIYIVPARGGKPYPVTDPGTSRDWSPAWSPDGSRIAFVRAGKLTLLELASGKIRRLGVDALHVRWLPDGRTIVFDRYGGRYGLKQLGIVNADGSERRPLIPPREHVDQATPSS
jgi:Tol biopolymer transport system component